MAGSLPARAGGKKRQEIGQAFSAASDKTPNMKIGAIRVATPARPWPHEQMFSQDGQASVDEEEDRDLESSTPQNSIMSLGSYAMMM